MLALYKIEKDCIRRNILRIVMKCEGGECYSTTLRKIFKKYYYTEIGMYSMGGCFNPDNIHAHTTIGRYCSFARQFLIVNRNHPLEFRSTHGLFFNPKLGVVKNDPISFQPLEIGNDVWVGHNAVIFPNVNCIGDGAVIAASAVVNKDVPPYAVVVGNPARVVRYRFSTPIIESLLESKWWEKSIDELKNEINDFQKPLEQIKKFLETETAVFNVPQ